VTTNAPLKSKFFPVVAIALVLVATVVVVFTSASPTASGVTATVMPCQPNSTVWMDAPKSTLLVDYSGRDLTGCNFKGLGVGFGMNYTYSSLAYYNFENTNLTSTIFDGAIFGSASFSGAKISRSTLGNSVFRGQVVCPDRTLSTDWGKSCTGHWTP
jgi:hypothetical protein